MVSNLRLEWLQIAQLKRTQTPSPSQRVHREMPNPAQRGHLLLGLLLTKRLVRSRDSDSLPANRVTMTPPSKPPNAAPGSTPIRSAHVCILRVGSAKLGGRFGAGVVESRRAT